MIPFLKMITSQIVITFHQHIVSLIIFGTIVAVGIYIREKIGLKKFLIEIKEKFFKEPQYKWQILFFTYFYFIFDKSLLSRSKGMINNLDFAFKRDWLFFVKDTWSKVQASENIIFFIPFSFFLSFGFGIKSIKKIVGICLGVSLFIELIQFTTTLGTFQLSDIVYNVSGGVMGIIFSILFRWIKNKKSN